MSRVKRGLQLACLLGPLVLLAVPALARSETTFESSDHRVICEMGSNWVLCIAPPLAHIGTSRIDGEICDKGAFNEESAAGEPFGPGAIELAPHGRPLIIGACVISREEIGVLYTGYRIRNGSETCHGRSSSSIICQSRSGHYFIVGAHRYRRR
jgi:hypothetical protein